MASTIDKVKHALHLDKSATHTHTTGTTGTSGTAEGVHGPHGSRVANAADPRVDSDRDGSHNIGSNNTYGNNGTGLGHSTHTTGTGVGHSGATTGTGIGHSTHTTGTGVGHTGATSGYNTTAGPHSSDMANKLDPRVDSDRDGSANLGAAHNTHNTTSGLGNPGTYSGTHAGNHTGHAHTGTAGGISHSTNAGPHNSNLLNKADPTVDSDLDGRGNRHGAHTGGITGASGSHATPGSGTAQNTAGPHNSDLLNKLDPRVDADRDGSKTIGGNKTYA
jgi:hypothetical protein